MGELQCVGDNSCEGDPTDPRKIGYYNVKNSHGMSCSHDSCRTATYQLTSNVGGGINCNGEESCFGADITINNIESVFCGGIASCSETNILIMNPENYFYIACTGPRGCLTLTMEIMVTNPTIDFIESISCMSADACKGASITVYKQRATAKNPLRIGRFRVVQQVRVLEPFLILDRMSLWNTASVLLEHAMACWESRDALHHQPYRWLRRHQHRLPRDPLLLTEERILESDYLAYWRLNGVY